MYIKKDILATLSYFNMFDYPLKKREIFAFLGHACDLNEFEMELGVLIEEGIIFKMGDFYGLRGDHALVSRRQNGNRKAAIMLRKANKSAGIISAFPFVKGVAVSGSLSKNFADDGADIDFFIITSANRLWIARTFLHLFKKFTYLFRMQHRYCMNYFIDEAEQVILERNIYTATEVVTILPLRGTEVFDRFYQENNWTNKFLPNSRRNVDTAKDIKRSWFRRSVERVLDNGMGDALDNFLMNLTAKSWSAKTRRNKKNGKGMLMSLHTGKHFSKPDPANLQRRLLQQYEKCISEIFERVELSAPLKNEAP